MYIVNVIIDNVIKNACMAIEHDTRGVNWRQLERLYAATKIEVFRIRAQGHP